MNENEKILREIVFLREDLNELLGRMARNQLSTVAAPAIACADNEVTITCATEGATIYYTTDGSVPTEASDVYSEAVTITATKTFKAFAKKLDCNDSAVSSAICEYVAPES